jgi:hypothetical protein
MSRCLGLVPRDIHLVTKNTGAGEETHLVDIMRWYYHNGDVVSKWGNSELKFELEFEIGSHLTCRKYHCMVVLKKLNLKS